MLPRDTGTAKTQGIGGTRQEHAPSSSLAIFSSFFRNHSSKR